MMVIVVGLGVQGRKRVEVAGEDVVGTVDPVVPSAQYKCIEQVPVERFEAGCVCTSDQAKVEILNYLLSRGKHVLVEKPLLADNEEQIRRIEGVARSNGVTCYTAYNHRFEPHLIHLKKLLDDRVLGDVYLAKFFYGNGTARDVKNSTWRDQGWGVLSDLGSHLLDLVLFFFGHPEGRFMPWSFNRFENRAFDHVLFGFTGKPMLELEATLVSWRNTFSVDVFGELGSAHVNGLCKWGPCTLTVRKRVFPSGRPDEKTHNIEHCDPTWASEYEHFKKICQSGATNISNDLWINGILNHFASTLETYTGASDVSREDENGAPRKGT